MGSAGGPVCSHSEPTSFATEHETKDEQDGHHWPAQSPEDLLHDNRPMPDAVDVEMDSSDQTRLLAPWNYEISGDEYPAPEQRALSKTPSTVFVQDRGDSDHLVRRTVRTATFDTSTTDLEGIGSAPTLQIGEPPNSDGVPTIPFEPLENLLRRARVDSAKTKNETFIPLDTLDGILTPERVQHELRECFPGSYLELSRQIIETKDIGNDVKTSRRKIFAILVLIEKTRHIADMVREGLYDHDLPFEIDKSDPGSPALARRVDDKVQKLEFCCDWTAIHHENFEKNQWGLLAPYFELRGSKAGSSRRLHKLRSKDILPFVFCEALPPTNCSEVFKIQIHQDHHHDPTVDHNPFFAMKHPFMPHEEFRVLDRLTKKPNPHMIRSMGMFEQDDCFYVLFPWADGGNLQDLWKAMPDPPNCARPPDWAMWLAQQVVGLAKALAQVHTCKLDEDEHPISMNISEVNRKYGIHGDLKPENILWFKKNGVDTNIYPHGLLVIADFGFATFNGSEAAKTINAKGVTTIYRSPEYEDKERVSQKSDIWAFGCVLMEWITWYLEGLPGVRAFEASRSQESYGGIMDKAFFEVEQVSGYPVKVTHKESVIRHLSRLCALPHCPDFAIDLIGYIKQYLFRINPESRSELDKLVVILEKWRSKCLQNEAYVTKREVAVIDASGRTWTGSSELDFRSHGLHGSVQAQLGDAMQTEPSQPKTKTPDSCSNPKSLAEVIQSKRVGSPVNYDHRPPKRPFVYKGQARTSAG